MDIFVPNRKLWIPDNTIADSLASPPAINRMIQYNKRIHRLTPHRVIMGAAGGDNKASYSFGGTGGVLSIADHSDFTVGLGHYTIDTWVRLTNNSKEQYIFSKKNDAVTWPDIEFAINSSNYIWGSVGYPGNNGYTRSIASNNPLSTGIWYYVQMVVNRTTNVIQLFVGGTETSYSMQQTISGAVNDVNTYIKVGGSTYAGAAASTLDGNIDDFRISKGVIRSSTPPSSEHTSDADTKLLIHCNEAKTGTTGSGATFTDSGNTGHTVTENGDAIEDTVNYKF